MATALDKEWKNGSSVGSQLALWPLKWPTILVNYVNIPQLIQGGLCVCTVVNGLGTYHTRIKWDPIPSPKNGELTISNIINTSDAGFGPWDNPPQFFGSLDPEGWCNTPWLRSCGVFNKINYFCKHWIDHFDLVSALTAYQWCGYIRWKKASVYCEATRL